MAVLTTEQVEELKVIYQTALDSCDVALAALAVVKRRLEACAETSDVVLDRPA